MKKMYKIMIVTFLGFFSAVDIFGREQQNIAIHHAQSSVLFTAEDGSTGKYWPEDKTAILDEKEYIKVVAINKSLLTKKASQKLKKNKIYLGSFVDKKSERTYYVYGVVKKPVSINNGPDADVLTQIAIEVDYGPGE